MYVCMYVWYVYSFETLSAKCIFEILFIIMGQMSYTYIYICRFLFGGRRTKYRASTRDAIERGDRALPCRSDTLRCW